MTTHQTKRCKHCGGEYRYQGSGHGCVNPLNSSTWCPVCKRAILGALEKVPRLFECRYRNIREIPEKFPDVTLDRLLDWEQENLRAQKGQLVFQRIFVPLINLETGDSQNSREVRGPNGQKYMLSTWRQSPEYEVKVQWEWDLQAGAWTGCPWP